MLKETTEAFDMVEIVTDYNSDVLPTVPCRHFNSHISGKQTMVQ